jgi:hypothetical protein
MTTGKLAKRIRDKILADVTDRRGWRQEWDGFGDDIQSEIRVAWLAIIKAELDTAAVEP